jgi:hypothetical protein
MLRSRLSLAVIAFCFSLIAGCGGGGSSSTPSVTSLMLSSTAVSFGSQALGTSATTSTVTLSNAGNTAISFTSITLSSTTSFSMTSGCTGALPAGSSCVLTFGFTPASIGALTATVTITDSAPGSPQSIALAGTGTGTGTPTVTFSPGTLTFPATNVGTSSASISETISNYGTAALTISSIGLTGSGASFYSQTNNCPASLPALTGTCTVYVTFTPTTPGTLAASISVADNAAGSPQTASVTGSGVAVAPVASLATTNLNFTSTPGVASASQTITLTNTGNATLNISGITLGGANLADFALTTSATPCGATLAAGASCIISADFTPLAATTYAATVTIADNAANTPQVITLNGNGGSTAAVYRTLFVIPEADNSVTPLYTLINGATKTIDMTMYEMQDTTFLNDLIARCKAGVVVRVIFSSSIASSSAASYTALNAQSNCSAVDSNSAFTNTHQKTITVDAATANATTAILSLNLQTQYYSTTRDYGIITNDAADIAAIETTFGLDYAAGGTNSATDFNYQPLPGDDLVWSPTTATTDMLAIINNAKTSLYIECEEFSATNIVNAIAAAATRGVKVVFICENESNTNTANFAIIKAAGANVWYYSSSTGFYVHAKAVVADLGLSTEAVYMGSINYSTASLTQNRELGVYITGNTAVSNPIAATIAATIVSDEAGSGVTKY